MIEETLGQYGLAGAVILFFMGTITWVFKWITNNLTEVVRNNTEALTKVHEVIKQCPNVQKY